MKKISNYSSYFTEALLSEWKSIFKDKAVFSSFIGVAILISFLFTYLYSRETLPELPIGIIDNDNTNNSRQLSRMIDSSKEVFIFKSYVDLEEAKTDFQRQNIKGIISIPKGFSRDLQRGEQPVVSVYADASYMLYYKQVLTSSKVSIAFMNAGIQMKKTASQGKLPDQSKDETMAVSSKLVNLYNPSMGYATFLIPIVLVLIFQVTILTGMGILGGTMREENYFSQKTSVSLGETFFGVLGKASVYVIISLFILGIMLGVVVPLFNIPMRGSFSDVILYMVPFLLSVVFLGLFLLNFFKKREDAILIMSYTSVPAILLMGFVWPIQSIPQMFQWLGYFVPSTLGAKGFVSITQMGATLSIIQDDWLKMWGLCLFYLILAVFSVRRLTNKKTL